MFPAHTRPRRTRSVLLTGCRSVYLHLQTLAGTSVNATTQAFVLDRLNTALQSASSLSAADLTPSSVAVLVSVLGVLLDPSHTVSGAILDTIWSLVRSLAAKASGDASQAFAQVFAAILQRRGIVRTLHTGLGEGESGCGKGSG